MKKIVALLLCIITLVSTFALTASAADTKLKFGKDGEFKIVLFADSQDDEKLEETTTALMKAAIKKENPDLVIFLGDNTVAEGYDNQKAAIEALVAPCIESNTPYAIVFGNHDQENEVTKEELLEIYAEYGCLTYNADDSIHGYGNCNLPILSSDGTKTAFNLWLIDSGSRVDPENSDLGYDYVRESQIEWYKATAAALKEANGGETVPALQFQHIVPSEIYEATGMAEIPLGLKDWTIEGQSYFPIPYPGNFDGMMLETPCPSYNNAGHMDAVAETGDVMGVFFGHDHINNYTASYKGINLTNVASVGGSSYNRPLARGYGVITLDEDDLSTYDYEFNYYSNLALNGYPELAEVEGAPSKLEMFLSILFREVIFELRKALTDFLAEVGI